MIKLFSSSKVLFIADDMRGYYGWDHLSGVLSSLYFRLGKDEDAVHEVVDSLLSRGYISPQDSKGETYLVLEKAIPFDIRGAVRRGEIPLDELLPQLKV